jgi:hypothetical protein
MRETRSRCTRAGRSWLGLAIALGVGAFVQVVPLRARAADPSADAQALVDKAYQEHAAGNDTLAVGTYLKAYDLSHAAAILYNVATIYDRRLHERSLAAEYFRRYIQAPDAITDLVQKATARITALKKEIEEEDAKRMAELAARPPSAPSSLPAATPATTQPDRTETPSPPPSEGGWSGLKTTGAVVGAAGILGVGASLILGAVAKSKIDDANKVCGPTTCSTQDGVTEEHAAVSLSTAATVTFVTGATFLAAGGAIFFLAHPSQTSSAQITVAPQVGAKGGGITAYASF